MYVTDGAGRVTHGETHTLGQYDVMLGRPDMDSATIEADPGTPLHFLSFYLPKFLA